MLLGGVPQACLEHSLLDLFEDVNTRHMQRMPDISRSCRSDGAGDSPDGSHGGRR